MDGRRSPAAVGWLEEFAPSGLNRKRLFRAGQVQFGYIREGFSVASVLLENPESEAVRHLIQKLNVTRMINQSMTKSAWLCRRVRHCMGDIGDVRKVSLELRWAEHVLAVATRQNQIMDLADILRTKNAGDVLNGKTGRGVILLVGVKGIAQARGRLDRATMEKDKQRMVVRQTIREREFPQGFSALHINEVIAFIWRLRRRVE